MTERMPFESRRVPGAHGLTLHLVDWCPGGLRPGAEDVCLLLHGFGLSARVWDPIAARLAERHPVLALDLRGHGGSDHDPQYRYHHVAIGRDVLSAIDALELRRVIAVAHSTAGHAMMGLAARHPERVRALALIDAGAELPRKRDDPSERSHDPIAIHYESPDDYAAALLARHPHARPEAIRAFAEHALRRCEDGRYELKLDPAFVRPRSPRDPEHRRNFDREAWAKQGEEALWKDLAQVQCPTWVVRGGESDRLSPATVSRMVDDVMPNAHGCEIAGAGHNVMLDQPQKLYDVLNQLLAMTSASDARPEDGPPERSRPSTNEGKS